MIDDSDIEEIQDQLEKLVNQVHELEVRSGMKVNKIKCEGCQTFLESTYTHDFQECGCENHSFCDGGTEYQRIGGKDLSQIKVWHYEKGWQKIGKKE
jgi:predicted transcriptional regulator